MKYKTHAWIYSIQLDYKKIISNWRSYYCGGCSVGSSGPGVVVVAAVVGTVGLVGVVGPGVGGGIVPSTTKHSDGAILVGFWYQL